MSNKKKKKGPPPQARLHRYTLHRVCPRLLSASHLCLVGTGAWNANRWCRARGESPPGRGQHYHTAGRSGWLPRCDDRQPGCRAASVRARSAIPIPLRRMLVTSYSCKGEKIKLTTRRHNAEWKRNRGDDGYLKHSSAVHPCAQRRCIHLGQFSTQMCLQSDDINTCFGMTLHANRTFHVCSFGYAAISRSFCHTARIQSVSRRKKPCRMVAFLLPMQMSDVYWNHFSSTIKLGWEEKMQLGCSRWCSTREVGYCDRLALIVQCKDAYFSNKSVLSAREDQISQSK